MNSGPARVEACQSETESNVYNVLERDKAIVLLPENIKINKNIVFKALFYYRLLSFVRHTEMFNEEC